jgi:hypothetical protein
VSACAAFENLAKSFFVEWALHDVSLIEQALSRSVKLSGHDFLLNETDRLFILLIASTSILLEKTSLSGLISLF